MPRAAFTYKFVSKKTFCRDSGIYRGIQGTLGHRGYKGNNRNRGRGFGFKVDYLRIGKPAAVLLSLVKYVPATASTMIDAKNPSFCLLLSIDSLYPLFGL
jgi:hypothetical protein